MDCRTTSAQNLLTLLGFKQFDVVLTNKQILRTKIISWFKGENMQIQYSVLGYRILTYIFMTISSQ